MDEWLIDLAVILGIIQTAFCVVLFCFGFKEPIVPQVPKPIDFDWLQEGF